MPELNDAAPRKIWTVQQACEYVHVSRRTMYNWMDEKQPGGSKVEVCFTPSGTRRIYVDSLTKPSKAVAAARRMCWTCRHSHYHHDTHDTDGVGACLVPNCNCTAFNDQPPTQPS